jgi:RNA polymerase sigma factor (sigma-70 family)
MKPRYRIILDPILKLLGRQRRQEWELDLDDETWEFLQEIAEENELTIGEAAQRVLAEQIADMRAAEAYQALWKNLTQREKQVTTLYCQGMKADQIAQELVISKETVKTHLQNAARKMGLKKVFEIRRIGIPDR